MKKVQQDIYKISQPPRAIKLHVSFGEHLRGLIGIFEGGVSTVPQVLTLFQTKLRHFPYPFSYLTKTVKICTRLQKDKCAIGVCREGS